MIFHCVNYQTLDIPSSASAYFFDILSLNNTSFLIDSFGESPPFSYGFNISSVVPSGYSWEVKQNRFGSCPQNLTGSIYITSYHGPWVGILNQYFPIRLLKNSEYYYGWVEMSTDTSKSLSYPLGKYIVHNYKINSIPNEPIWAGE